MICRSFFDDVDGNRSGQLSFGLVESLVFELAEARVIVSKLRDDRPSFSHSDVFSRRFTIIAGRSKFLVKIANVVAKQANFVSCGIPPFL